MNPLPPDQRIPAPPRQVRWRAAARAFWPAGLAGGILSICGLPLLVIALSTGIDLTSLNDMALDERASRARGEVEAVESTDLHWWSKSFRRVRYRFLDQEAQPPTGLRGASLSPHDDYRAGASCWIEYLPGNPSVNRLEGTRRQAFGSITDLLLGCLCLPGIVLLLIWLRATSRLRLLLREGRGTIATIRECRYVPAVNPPQLRVDYEFRDDTRRERHGVHWVGERSELGRTLRKADGTTARTAQLIYASETPDRSRLVCASDFHES